MRPSPSRDSSSCSCRSSTGCGCCRRCRLLFLLFKSKGRKRKAAQVVAVVRRAGYDAFFAFGDNNFSFLLFFMLAQPLLAYTRSLSRPPLAQRTARRRCCRLHHHTRQRPLGDGPLAGTLGRAVWTRPEGALPLHSERCFK